MTAPVNDCAAVLFDLDGTLIDTAPDMTRALNRLCREHGRPALDYSEARRHVSRGAKGLVKLGFPDIDDEEADPLVRQFRDFYADCVTEASYLFEGMDDVLAVLEALGKPWGIVTNKPEQFTAPLVAALGLDARAACIISGDTLEHSKPHPLPLLRASELVGHPAADCIYVGDDERDVIAGRAAGMRTIAALYGYILEEDDPAAWQADGMIRHPRDVLNWLGDDARIHDNPQHLAR